MGEDMSLGGDIALHAAVPVQVIGRDVGQDRHVGREAVGQVQLIGRGLDHIDGVGRRLRQGQHADAYVAADMDGETRLLQHPADQGGGGGLAVGAGDGDDLGPPGLGQGGDGAGEQLQVADHRNVRGPRLIHCPVRARMGQRRARRQHQGGEAGPVGARQVLDREPFRLRLHASGHAVVPEDRPRAAGLQRARGRDAGPSQAEDRDPSALMAGNGDHASSAASASTGRPARGRRR